MYMKIKQRGQSLVEFALILPILVLLLLGIFEGGHIIQAYISAQNASQQAARFAVAGRPLNNDGDPWTRPDHIRVEAIKQIAINASVGTAYTQIYSTTNIFEDCNAGSDPNCSGVLGIQIEGQNDTSLVYETDSAGIQGLNVKVRVYHNVEIWDPIYAAIAPGGFVRVRAETVMRNEGVDVTLGGLETIIDNDPSPPNNPPLPPPEPFIDALEGDTFSPDSQMTFRLINHTAGNTYDIYFNDGNSTVKAGSVVVDGSGTALLPWTIPSNTVLGGRLIKSTPPGQPDNPVAQNTLIIESSQFGDIIINNNTSPQWPLNSLLEYRLVEHDGTSAVLEISGAAPDTTVRQTTSFVIDENTRESTTTENYIIPDTLAEGVYVFNTAQATRTVTFVEGCIKVDQGVCDEPTPPVYPDQTQIFVHVENHAANRQYRLDLVDEFGATIETIADIITDGSGQRFGTLYTIPANRAGKHFIVSYDTGNPNDIPGGREIVRKEITINTPNNAFIVVQGGYKWPSGSTILYQLRKHEPNTRYDIYWTEVDPPQDSTKIYTNTNAPTNAVGEVWLDYTIPDDIPTGLYDLQSRLGVADGGVPTTPISGTTLYPIEVQGQPYLNIKEGNPQVPGATITIELGTHVINSEYDLYLVLDNGDYLKISDDPVVVDGNGDGELEFLIPTTLETGQSYLIQSYPKDSDPENTDPTAETTLTLTAPDLQVTAINLPVSPSFNTPITVSVTVANMSGVTITHRSFDVDLYIDPLFPPNLGRSLPPGETKLWLEPPFPMNSTRTITTQITLYGAFEHDIWGRADTSNRVIETDELNNLLNVSVVPQSCQLELTGSNFSDVNTIAYGDADDISDPATISISGETVTLTNKGSGSSGLNDNDFGYFFAYQQLTNDFDVRVRAVSQTGGNGLNDAAHFGLEVRASLDPDADKIQWVTSKGQSLGYQQRQLNTGIPLDGEFGLGANNQPVWLRIVKAGSKFTLYYSTDNANPPDNWIEMRTLTANGLAGNVYLGLMNTPLDGSQANEVTFDGFHVCGNVGGTCGPVREAQGLIVINATNFINSVADTNQDPNLNGLKWAGTVRDDLSGMVVPKQNPQARIGNGDDVEKAARLDYEVDVSNAGTYYVWLLAARPANNDQDNSAYFGLRSEPPDRSQYWRTRETPGQIEWFDDVLGGGVNQVNLKVGQNMLSLWMHKDGFELYQILLTKDENFDPTGQGTFNQSQCASLGVPPAPPGLQQCQESIVNGDFESDALMSEWIYPSISQQVSRTTAPHFFGPNQSFSMVLPDTLVGCIPRQPWLYQEFTVPSWIITPTINAGTTMKLKLHAGVNPEGSPEPDELFVTLRDQTGTFNVTNPVTVAIGSEQPTLVPPVNNNNGWKLKEFNLAQAFNSPADLLQYRDQNLQLYFEAPNPAGSDSTQFYLDNVSLEICSTEPTPDDYNTLVAGEIRVLIDGVPTAKPGIFVWIYAIEGEMQKTYTIQDSSFSFYDLPAASGGTTYILYAEYEEDDTFYSASTIILLRPGDVIDDIAMLLF